MENQIIICPAYQRRMSDKSVIAEAVKGVGADTQFLVCERGERITYWQITAQRRAQKTLRAKF